MHFRPFDAELHLGLGKVRDDTLGIIPHRKGHGLSSPSTPKRPPIKLASAPKASPPANPEESERGPVQGPRQRQQYPKRVSFTSEERTLSVSDDNESDDGKDKKGSEESVAAILRQMSQVPRQKTAASTTSTEQGRGEFANASSAKAVASMKALGCAEQEAALTLAGKRSIPTSFQTGDSAEASSSPKRVRWLETAVLQDSSARFFHRMPRRANANITTAVSAPLSVVPVLKPVPGLQAYDVLIGRDFISHFNLGNRRLLVLASALAEKYPDCEPEEQEHIVDSLYEAIQSAGGRFVQMHGQTSGYEDTSADEARAAINEVLVHQQKSLDAGTSIITMFQRRYSSIWGGDMEGVEEDEGHDNRPAAVPSQEEDYGSTSEDSGSPSGFKKPIKKLEPMTPLGPDFQPGPFDVICSRGSAPKKHPGNMWFVNLVEQNCERYIKAEGKMGKSVIVSEILDIVRKNSPGGGFVKQDEQNKWCETGDHLAREKIGQCFRDRLHTRYSSSSRAKLEKRRSSKASCDGSMASTD